MSIQSRLLTFEDLERLREETTDRLELIGGKLYVTPSPTRMHQLVLRRLVEQLQRAVVDTRDGEFFFAPYDVTLAGDIKVQPDLLAVTSERLSVFAESESEGAPDFVVEIVSPSTVRRDRVFKRNLYARHGVSEYWLVDSEARSVTIYTDPREGHYRKEQVTTEIAVSVIFPNLAVVLADLFSPFRDT